MRAIGLLLAMALVASCGSVSDSSWFTIEGISLPGDAEGTGTMAINLPSVTSVTADLHLRNGGTAPGTGKGTAIRGFTVTMHYRFPGTSFQLAGFTQNAVGYLPAPVEGEASTTVVSGIALLTADRIAVLRDDPSRPWGSAPFTMQVDLTVVGETDEGSSVVATGSVTITVTQDSATPTATAATPTRTPTPTATPSAALPASSTRRFA